MQSIYLFRAQANLSGLSPLSPKIEEEAQTFEIPLDISVPTSTNREKE